MKRYNSILKENFIDSGIFIATGEWMSFSKPQVASWNSKWVI